MSEEVVTEEEAQEDDGFETYICQTCGTVFTIPVSVKNSSCVFCGSKKANLTNDIDYSDYYVLPFVETLNDAIKTYKSKVRYNFLLPRIFRSKKTISAIKRVYLPCMLYSTEVSGKIRFLGADKVRGIKGLPTQTFEISYDTNIKYDNALVCGFDKIHEDMLCAINDFMFSPLQEFSPKGLKNIYIIPMNEYQDDNTSDFGEKVSKNTIALLRENIKHELKKVDSNDLKVNFTSIKKTFMPVYFVNVIYNKKNYIFLMNGHTGTYTIDLVASKLSILLFSLLVFVIVFALVSLAIILL